ncbi:MAG TPA: ABC transporter permease subunit, partial [Aquihabitans sp.]|jgi:iron(III) transport system permease protein|nr:ABC transporter permease subunit [Aquihabitans sp.]
VLERSFRGRARYAEQGRSGVGLRRRRLRGPAAWGATAVATSVVLLGFGLPTAQLVAWAVDEQSGPRGTPQLDRYTDYLGNSLTLTAATVAVCLVVATLIANAGRFSSSRAVGVARRTATVGYAVPGAVVAMGVVLALVALDRAIEGFGLTLPGTVATGSFLALVYAYAVRFLAPAVTSLESGLEQVPRDLSASARSLGAHPLRVVRSIHLPLSRASVLTAAVLVGVDALKELPVALLLRPIGFDTLPVWVYNLASESRFQQAALPALTIITAAIAPVAILCWRLDRGRT